MTIDWMSLAVRQTAGLHPYIPGKPIEQLLREKGLKSAVKLASNENPYGPSPKAVEAIRSAASGVHLYPDGDCTALKAAIAAHHGINTDRILLGNGSNEVLELLIRAFAGRGDEVVFSRRGFIVYALAAQAAGARGVAVPEADGLSHDLDAMAAAVGEQTKLVCLANPNNPTGTLHDNDAIQAFLDKLPREVVVILDEAYYEFVADQLGDTVAKLSHPGLVISRTFSKAFGLAGMRVGYAVADAALVAVVNRFREPFNVNLPAQAAAKAALSDLDWVMDKVAAVNAERARLEEWLDGHGLLGGRSFGNFVLLRHEDAKRIWGTLEDRGIITRPLVPYGMTDVLRVSVGTPKENEAFMQALGEVLAA